MILTKKFSRVKADFPENIEDIQEIHGLGGSTGAMLVEDPRGRRFVMKGGNSPGHIREEETANEVYRTMDVPVPKSRMYEKQGRPYKLSQFHKGVSLAYLKKANPEGYQRAIERLGRHFVMDALLGNWDTLGTHLDNILVDEDGNVLRIDNGGALRYRAQGALKSPGHFSNVVSELKSLRDPSMNRNSAEVFGSLSNEEIWKQINEVVEKRASILAAVPEDLRDILSQRIDYLDNYARGRKGSRLFVSRKRVGDMVVTPYFSRVRLAVSDERLKKSIQEKMKEIRDRYGKEYTDGGEPQILLNKKTNEVWVSAGDWHGKEVVREVFDELGELEGVSDVDGESESYPEGYHYGQGESVWEKVYP